MPKVHLSPQEAQGVDVFVQLEDTTAAGAAVFLHACKLLCMCVQSAVQLNPMQQTAGMQARWCPACTDAGWCLAVRQCQFCCQLGSCVSLRVVWHACMQAVVHLCSFCSAAQPNASHSRLAIKVLSVMRRYAGLVLGGNVVLGSSAATRNCVWLWLVFGSGAS